MKTPQIYQIFYDDATRLALDPGFLPLDNTSNERPDWFELFVIRRFLRTTPLQPDTWYGFFSPKFRDKTTLRAQDVHGFLEAAGADADVALFSHAWDQIAYFRNPFEQGEVWHPGMTQACQEFLDREGVELDLRNYLSHSGSTVFSNYLAAKPAFWARWLMWADALFEDVESGASTTASVSTAYGNRGALPMQAFIQERLACVLLATSKYRVAVADLSGATPVCGFFHDDMRTRRLLAACDAVKQEHALSGDPAFKEMFERLRAAIPKQQPITLPFG